MRFGRLARISTAASSRSDVSNVTSRLATFRLSDLLCRPALRDFQLRDDLFLDAVQTILAEEDLITDEEGRRTEGATRHRIAGVLDQLLLDVVLLRAGDQTIDVDARRQERVTEHLRIVHLFWLDPHVMIGGTEIRFE